MSDRPTPARLPVGLVAVGHGGRPDLVREFGQGGAESRVLVRGALDELGEGERPPSPQGRYPVSCPLRDGSRVDVASSDLEPLMNAAATALAQDGARFVVVFCTARFVGFSAPVPWFLPVDLIDGAIRGLRGISCMGVVAPTREQERFVEEKWGGLGVLTVPGTVDPAAAPGERDRQFAEALERFRGEGVEAILLDCMGFGTTFANGVRAAVAEPVIVPRELTVRAIRSMLLEGDPLARSEGRWASAGII